MLTGSIISDGGVSSERRSKRLAGISLVSVAESGSLPAFYSKPLPPEPVGLHTAYVCYPDREF